MFLEAASKSPNTSGGVQLEQPWWRFPSNMHWGICRRYRTNERRGLRQRLQKEFTLPNNDDNDDTSVDGLLSQSLHYTPYPDDDGDNDDDDDVDNDYDR
jgi:hypothetical protein